MSLPATAFASVGDVLAQADEVAARLGYPDPSMRQEYHRHVLMILAQAYTEIFSTRVENPDWMPHTGPLYPWGAPNQDANYAFAPIDPNGVYRVTGTKGTETVATIMYRKGGANTGQIHGAPVGEIDLRKVKTDADGRFSFLCSQTRPEGYDGEWYAIPPVITGFLLRHFILGPEQVEGTTTIERLDRAPMPTAPDEAETARLAGVLASFVAKNNEFMLTQVQGLRDRGFVHAFDGDHFPEAGGIPEQIYFQTLFELEEDEALILESELPRSVYYWGCQLFDALYSGIDYVFHQSALNCRDAVIDADGKVRFVVSIRDPGVANWLDTAGWKSGGIMWRWHTASSFPKPSVRKVKLAEVAGLLPADTRRISEAERIEQRGERIRYFQSRRRW